MSQKYFILKLPAMCNVVEIHAVYKKNDLSFWLDRAVCTWECRAAGGAL